MGKARSISRRVAFWLTLVVAIAGGVYLLPGPAPYYSQFCNALTRGQRNLDDMAQLLRSYKAAHGRYPTMDEGLSVLEGYALRFRLKQYHPRLWRARKLSHRPWPANEEELRAFLERGLNRLGGHESEDPNLCSLEAAICDSGHIYILYNKEPLDLTNAPYCYENNQSGSSQGGGRSLIPADPHGMFSRSFDGGVRVSSFGSRLIWAQIAPLRRRKLLAELVFGVCVLIPACWWLCCWLRDRRDGGPGLRLSALLWLFLGFGLTFCLIPTLGTAYELAESAYRPIAGKSYRTFQKDILGAGLIGQETYDRRIRAASLDNDLGEVRYRIAEQDRPVVDFYTPRTTTRPEDGNDTDPQ